MKNMYIVSVAWYPNNGEGERQQMVCGLYTTEEKADAACAMLNRKFAWRTENYVLENNQNMYDGAYITCLCTNETQKTVFDRVLR